MMLSADKPHRILQCDPSLSCAFEFSAKDVIGHTMRMMFGPKTDSKTLDCNIKNALLHQETKFLSLLYSQRGGDPRPVTITCTPIEESGETSRLKIMLHCESEIEQTTKSTNDEQIIGPRNSDVTSVQEHHTENPFAHEVISRVCIAQYLHRFEATNKFRCFWPQLKIQYHAFCDDFGPMNFESIARFIQLLDNELSSHPSCKIVYCADEGRRALTNAVFLLGAYMILKLDMVADEVQTRFTWLRPSAVEAFRDASYSEPDFGLTLLDCWRGLERGRNAGWVGLPSGDSSWWGMTDVERYAHYDSPLNGDMHVVVPGKLVALRGPVDLPCGDYSDAGGRREFSPGHYAPVLEELGVTAVVRLNEAEYDAGAVAARGLAHHDLAFEDCSAPPDRVVRAFFDIVDGAAGAVAVHCKAGLGRTGTLIGLYLMRSHGFTAREAMGWLRIMRPGSVIGEQQHYLCRVEASGSLSRSRGPGSAALRRGPVPFWAGAAAGWRGARGAFLPARADGRSKSAESCFRGWFAMRETRERGMKRLPRNANFSC